MLLKGKTAVITGSNRGIGLAALERFAMNGAMYLPMPEGKLMNLRSCAKGRQTNIT